MSEHRYTYQQVEALLARHLGDRQVLDLHGKIGRGLRYVPRTDKRRMVAVNEAVIERADIMRALAKLDIDRRLFLFLWYASDYSIEQILAGFRQWHPRLHRRTLFKWRREAIREIVKIINGEA